MSLLSIDIEKLKVTLNLHSLRFQAAQSSRNQSKNKAEKLMRRRKMKKPQKLPTKLIRVTKISIVS